MPGQVRSVSILIKFDVLSVRRKIEKTFSDKKLYEIFDELSSLYENELISKNDLKGIKKKLLKKLNRLSVLKKQINRIGQAG